LKTTTDAADTKPRGERRKDSCCGSLSAIQEKYIELAVRKAKAEGTIRKSPSAFRCALEAKAREGTLDTSDLDFLEAWIAIEDARKERRDKAAEERQGLQDQFEERAVRHEENKALIFARISSSDIPIEQWHEKVLDAVKRASRDFKGKGVFGLAPHTELGILRELFPKIKNNSRR
jgi:hypothetical protein